MFDTPMVRSEDGKARDMHHSLLQKDKWFQSLDIAQENKDIIIITKMVLRLNMAPCMRTLHVSSCDCLNSPLREKKEVGKRGNKHNECQLCARHYIYNGIHFMDQ